jgi:hypothetical protein
MNLIKNNNRLYTNIIENKQNIMVFLNTGSINKCRQFLAYHKHMYGDWPKIESYSNKTESQIKIELQKIPQYKRLQIQQIKDTLITEQCSLEFTYFLQKVTNMELFGVTEFDYNLNNDKIQISMKGAQLEYTCTSFEEQNLLSFMTLAFDSLYYNKTNIKCEDDNPDDYLDIL